MARPSARLALCAAASLGALATSSPATAAALAPASSATDGTHAAHWQADELVSGHMPAVGGGADWGLTIDTAFMLAADGSESAVLARVTKAIGAHILDYAVYKHDTSAGAMAKVLVAADVLGEKPTDYGGVNVRKRLLALVAPTSAGFEQGRLRDSGKPDLSNVFTQAYGVIGLSRSGTVPQPVVGYLLKQECASGFFRLSEVVGKTCTQSKSGPDVDATSLAVQALIAAKADGATVSQTAITKAGNWLVSAQLANGSFSEQAGSTGADTNSTGLAGEALAATHHPVAEGKAAHWVSTLQITAARAGQGPAKKDIGAIAYDKASFTQGIAHGLGSDRYEWQRATPQAYFALVPTSLATLRAP